MARSLPPRRAAGFSMVEMLVALVFTMVLMAGMASVFKASLSTFFTSGEAMSSVRRNRLSIDLLGQDLDTAMMFLGEGMLTPPSFSTASPGFYILPNMPIVGVPTSPAAGDPTSADQLFFYVDQPVPFEPTLVAGIAQGATTNPMSFLVDCQNNAAYASLLAAGQSFVFMDTFEVGYIGAVAPSAGNQVTITTAVDPSAGVTGTGSTGIIKSHVATTRLLVYQPGQMVRYMVQYLRLDPNASDGNLIPCLVRDQGAFSTTGFTPSGTQQIITENVAAFKVYLSVSPNLVATNDAGAWAGRPATLGAGNTDMAGWNSLILGTTSPDAASITTQLAAANPSAQSPANDALWFRDNPVLVRVDLTTRTAASRTEYASTANTSAYKLLSQSLIFVPRHAGLPVQ